MDILGAVSTPTGERLIVDPGDAGSPTLVSGIANVRASSHMVRIDLYAEDRTLSDGRPAVVLCHRLAFEIDDFLRLADEFATHAAGIRKSLDLRPPHPTLPVETSAHSLPEIGEQIG